MFESLLHLKAFWIKCLCLSFLFLSLPVLGRSQYNTCDNMYVLGWCYGDWSWEPIYGYYVANSDEALDPFGNDRFDTLIQSYNLDTAFDGWWTASADMSLTITMQAGTLEELYANGLDCTCGSTTNIDPWTMIQVVLRLPADVLRAWAAANATRTPVRGQPNSNQTFPSPNGANKGKTTRVYGPDGKATHDIDYGDQSHSPWNPEVHDWDWSGPKPVRNPPRAPQPGDFPTGVPTTWP